MNFELSPSEFTDFDDKLGLFSYEPEPFEFLTVKEKTHIEHSCSDSSCLPKIFVKFILADTIYEYERQAYTSFTLLGDVGGFNSAIFIFPTFLMSHYSSRMYNSSVSTEIPVKKKNKIKQQNDLTSKL